MEHVRSLGEALTSAAATYTTEHKVSENVTDWRDEFSRNLSEAVKEFHRTLSASSRRVSDVYFGEDDEVESTRRTASKASSKAGDITKTP